MQVGLQTSGTSSIKSPLARGRISQPQSVNPTPQVVSEPVNSAFPESALLSIRPMRYNVNLNQQLTYVQQAESFLSKVENKLLQVSHGLSAGGIREGNLPTIKQHIEELDTLLNKRQALSGNTVDRQLRVALDKAPQVNFSLRGVESLLQHQESETLVFSLAGKQREIIAVNIREERSEQETLRVLNFALGKFKIHGQYDNNHQVTFSVNEVDWPKIRDNLSVKGEGHRYPEGQFFPVKLTAEKTLQDSVQDILNSPGQIKQKMGELRQSLEQVTQQRRVIARHRKNVQERIDGIGGLVNREAAVQSSIQLKEKLSDQHRDYRVLSQAVGGQANISVRTVLNLLS